MTDSRLPAGWLTNGVMDQLSDRAWRTFTGSLMWSNENGTDGWVPRRALRFLHPEGVDAATVGELVDANLWAPDGGDIRVPNWTGLGQELAETVEWRKERARERQRKWRASNGPKQKGVTSDKGSDITRDVGQEQRQMTEVQKTEEQALDGSEARDEEVRVTTWPTAVPGSGRRAS